MVVSPSNKLTRKDFIDICVDGKFVEQLKDMMLKFKGSSNQRTIDVQTSLKEGHVVIANGY